MPLDDALTDRQPDARAGILRAGMQALKDTEYPLVILRRDTDAVVLHRELPFHPRPLHADMNSRSLIVAPVLDRVSDQVLEQMLHLPVAHSHGRQRVAGD